MKQQRRKVVSVPGAGKGFRESEQGLLPPAGGLQSKKGGASLLQPCPAVATDLKCPSWRDQSRLVVLVGWGWEAPDVYGVQQSTMEVTQGSVVLEDQRWVQHEN